MVKVCMSKVDKNFSVKKACGHTLTFTWSHFCVSDSKDGKDVVYDFASEFMYEQLKGVPCPVCLKCAYDLKAAAGTNL
jgi:hypothetical protein